MNDPQREPEAQPSPQKKPRSAIERAVVWGGILLMLVVVVFEWRSREGHNGTINALETEFERSGTIPVAELEKHVQGYAIRGELKEGEEVVVTLAWPSLFKTYKLYLPQDHHQMITAFETQASRDGEIPDAAKKSHIAEPIDPAAAAAPAAPSPSMTGGGPGGPGGPGAGATDRPRNRPAEESDSPGKGSTDVAPDAAKPDGTDAPKSSDASDK